MQMGSAATPVFSTRLPSQMCHACVTSPFMPEAQHTHPHEGCQGGLLAISEDLEIFSQCQVPAAVEADVACDAAKV